MPSSANCSSSRAALLPFRFLGLAVAVAAVLTSCGRPSNPSAPEAQSSRFLGTWQGSVTSDTIGPGRATVVFDSQVGSDALPLLGGTWSLAFADPAFSTSGTVSASLDATGTMLGLFLSRSPVPCPGELDGVAQKAIAAVLGVSRDRLRGNYIAAGCPGGTLDLIRM